MIVQLDCENCDEGLVINYTGACRDQSRECCGGCSATETCSECNGSGLVDVDLTEHFDGWISEIAEAVETMYQDLTGSGVSKTEAKGLLRKLVQEIINEQ